MVSYYSWDNFDEQEYGKKTYIELGIVWDFTRISLTIFFQWRSYRSTWTGHLGYHLGRRDFVARLGKWLGSLGKTPPPSRIKGFRVFMTQSQPWNPKESEGIRRLVS